MSDRTTVYPRIDELVRRVEKRLDSNKQSGKVGYKFKFVGHTIEIIDIDGTG